MSVIAHSAMHCITPSSEMYTCRRNVDMYTIEVSGNE